MDRPHMVLSCDPASRLQAVRLRDRKGSLAGEDDELLP